MLKIVVPMTDAPLQLDGSKSAPPAYLAEMGGAPLIEMVVNHLTPREPHQFHFVVREELLRKWALDDVLHLVAPESKIIHAGRPMGGHLCSTLLAMGETVDPQEILVASADQLFGGSIDQFLSHARNPGVDGCIATFRNTHPRWCYVREEDGEVVQVAEKRPITDKASAGVHWFRDQRDLVEAAEQLILKNVGLVREFPVDLVFNELILMGRRITTWNSSTPESHAGQPLDHGHARSVKTRPSHPVSEA